MHNYTTKIILTGLWLSFILYQVKDTYEELERGNRENIKLDQRILGAVLEVILLLWYHKAHVKFNKAFEFSKATFFNAYTNYKSREVNRLENKFDQLGKAELIMLYQKNLVEKDDIGNYTLKYVCPLTLGLVVDPVVIDLVDGRKECYSGDFLKKYLERFGKSPVSPLSQVAIKAQPSGHLYRSFTNKEQCNYKNYLSALEMEIDALANANINKQQLT